MVTLSEDSGAHERRLWCGKDAGRRRRLSDCARNASVSVDQANQGASQVAGDKAELTRATDTAGARWRPRNRRETTASDKTS
jgi:hypothetical protein